MAGVISSVKYYVGRVEIHAVRLRLGKYVSGDISNNVVFKCLGNVYLGEDIKINPGCIFRSSGAIKISRKSSLSESVVVETACFQINKKDSGYHTAAEVVIGDNVWIAMHSIILSGVKIGND